MNLPLTHFATLCKYAGISFIAGAVNHGFFSGERSVLTAAIGVAVYLLGGVLDMRANPGSGQRWVDLLGLGIISSIGLGFFTGGLQHFPDSPARSAWVVPLGFVMSFLAFWLLQGREAGSRRAMASYGLGTGVVVAAGCLLAWQMLGEGSAHSHDHGGHSHGTPSVAATGPAPAVASSAATPAPGTAPNAAATAEVRIEMDDTMRFFPSVVEVTAGEPIKLVVVNRGRVRHELVLGTDKELAHHAQEMKTGKAHHHHDDNAIEVDPGQTKVITRTFKPGEQLGMACFEPGHYEAGMRGVLKVLPRS